MNPENRRRFTTGGILLGQGMGQVGEQSGGFLAFTGFESVGLGLGFVSI